MEFLKNSDFFEATFEWEFFEMSDKVIPVRVGVRIRPMSEKEEDEGCQQIAQVCQLIVYICKWFCTAYISCKIWICLSSKFQYDILLMLPCLFCVPWPSLLGDNWGSEMFISSDFMFNFYFIT